MIGQRLINGVDSSSVSAEDRGLQYGDGLFETMLAVGGSIRHFDRHMQRLSEGCVRLCIPQPAPELLAQDCRKVLEGLDRGVVKLILTRGPGPRGYRPPAEVIVTRIVTCSAFKAPPAGSDGLTLRICETRLGSNPQLAGLKHLNRLEQVLACAEWDDPEVAEGLMLSQDGRVVCATAANIFVARGGRLLTPEIVDCGVAGIMRGVVLSEAPSLGIDTCVATLRLDDLGDAQEVFLTSATRGIRPVAKIEGIGEWTGGALARVLRERLGPQVS
jgi:4-amino-4-deoxychorismate lyase